GGNPRAQHRSRNAEPDRDAGHQPRFPRLVLPRAAQAGRSAERRGAGGFLAQFDARSRRRRRPAAHRRAAAGVAARVCESNAVSVTAIPSGAPATAVARISRDEWLMRIGVALLVGWLALIIALPLWALLQKSFQNADGQFIGLANYVRYFSTPTLFGSIFNSIGV